MKLRFVVALLTLIGLLTLDSSSQPFVSAGQPDPGTYSAAEHKLVEFRNQMVPMRDGVKLAVDIFRPEGEGRFPVVLSQIPYNKDGGADRARWLAARGYVVVNADVRGRYESEGDWDPFDPKHKTDGYDLVEWLALQPWSTGKVGMWGLSYMGWTQWWTATQTPPSLVCIVPEVAPPDQFRNLPYQEGVLFGCMLDWAAANSGRTAIQVGPGDYGGFSNTRFEDCMHTPYIDLNKYRKVEGAAWFETWIRENLSTAPYWQAIAYQTEEEYAKVKVPSLAISGWFDADFPGTPMNYIAMKQYGGTPEARRPRLVIGPWTHTGRGSKLLQFDYGPTAEIDWNGYMCRWFDYHLKGVDNGVLDDLPVHVFVMGYNRWRAEEDWPLPNTKWTKYYIHSAGNANSSAGDGTLSTTPPSEEPPDRYTYDPLHPTLSAFTGPHIDGPVDTRSVSTGQDLLVYTTPPLEEDVEVVGPITAKLYAATSASDTDWMVRLVDVHPDGYAALLCDGVIRARCRDPERGGAFNSAKLSQIEPDKIYEYSIEFWRATGNAFLKGHRIRVEISSSYYPLYLRNLNTGADNVGLETSHVIAQQTIHHDTLYPSHVVLPVIPAVNAAMNAADPSVSAETLAELAAAARGVERISAHRGARLDRPENTIAAFERAIEAGATAVEIDVRTSRDGKLVIMHDAKVDRTTNGTGRINELTWAELAALDAGSWSGADYASERVPSLDQVLQVCRGRIDIHLDLKEEGEEYADRVVAAVKAYGEPTRTIAAVRTVEQARQLQKRLPEMKTLIFLRKKEQLESFLEANVNYVRPQISWIETDPTLLTKIREGGAKIHFDATTGTLESVLPLLKYCPESLLCDDPEQLVKTLAQLQAKD